MTDLNPTAVPTFGWILETVFHEVQGRLQIQHITKDDLGLFIFLPLLPEYGDHKRALSGLVYVVLGSNPLTSLAWPSQQSSCLNLATAGVTDTNRQAR